MKSDRPSSARKEPALSPAKRRAFALVTAFIPPLLLVLLEITLRVCDYGPDLEIFRTIDVAGRAFHVMNPDVTKRYFAQTSFNPATSHELFLVPKPAGTYRIFCLGGSTMVGYPYWYNAAPSTFLRDRLRRLFPSRHIEVINVGMTAINSFAVVDFARELVTYEPDLFIVYDGHNEFYGALGVASHETVGGVRWFTRLYLRLVRVRTFMLVRDLVGQAASLFGSSTDREPSGTMMEQLARGQLVPYRGSLYSRGLTTFQDNLQELREVCAARGVPLILSTQVSNLRTLPPFASGPSPGAAEADRSDFEATFARGTTSYSRGDFRGALARFREAEGVDSLSARTQFWIARCLDTLGEKGPALQAFVRARDYDQLRFRTSSDFNEAIVLMSDGVHVAVADAERAFASATPDGIIDSTLLFEHLHPRARGCFLMAKAYQEAMRQIHVLASPEEWAAADTLNERALWDERPLTELDEVVALRRTQILVSGWPFQTANRKIPVVPSDDPLGILADRMVGGKLTWEYGHVAAAEYYESRRDFERAAREYRTLVNQYPNVVSAYLRLGRTLSTLGRTAEAEQVYARSLAVEETPFAYRGLGRMANNGKRFAEAIDWFSKAITLQRGTPEEAEGRYDLALVFLNSGDIKRGTEELRELLRRFPNYTPARNLLQRMSPAPGPPSG
jgi:tetratricopeptide (TPR) repeat protein